MSIRVLIADDHDIVRSGLRMILDAQPGIEVIAEARDGREAVALARALRPDVCLFDIRMPDLNGLEATRALAGPDVGDPMAVVVHRPSPRSTSTSTSTALSRREPAASCSRTPDPSC